MRGERAIHDELSAWLKREGYVFFHSRMDAKTSTSVGDPDYVIARGQRVAFVEIKTHHGKLSPAQHRRHDELARAGCVVKVARSLEDAVKWVEHEMNGVKAEPVATPSEKPVFWVAYWPVGGKDVVVARDLTGELGFIRIASDLDKERFPRLTSWSPK
jgi:Holliday junction resolvase-like predicted endonuclease